MRLATGNGIGTLLEPWRRERVVAALLAAAVPLVLMQVLTVRGGRLVLPLLALVIGALLATAAVRLPKAAVLCAIAVVIVLPVYYGRYVVGTVAITPQSAAALVLVPLAITRFDRFRFTGIDAAVMGFIVLRSVSFLLNYETGLGAVIGVLLGVALPYAVFRLCVEPVWLPSISRVVVAVAALLSVVAIRERLGFGNPFFTLMSPSYQADALAHANDRLGAVRGEAGFGEPISFGMFLGLALGLTVMLAVTAGRRLERFASLAAGGVIAYGLTTTQSRGALAVGVLAVVGWLLASIARLDVLRLGVLLLTFVAVVLSTPVASSVSGLFASSTGDTRESRSAEYRLEILDVVEERSAFSLLGKSTEQDDGQGVTRDLQRRVGLKSIDSQFALVYLDGGLLGLIAFVTVAGLVVVAGVRPGLSPVGRAWVVGLGATFANLLTVALFTQESDVVWIATAVTATLIAGRRSEAR